MNEGPPGVGEKKWVPSGDCSLPPSCPTTEAAGMPCNLLRDSLVRFSTLPAVDAPWAERRLWDFGTANLAGVGRAGDFFPLVGRNRKAAAVAPADRRR